MLICVLVFNFCTLNASRTRCFTLYVRPCTTLLAGRKEDLAELIKRLRRESEKAGLYFNIKKTKIMTSAEWETFEIDGEEIQVVTCFSFLGSMIEKEGRCETEVRRRIILGKSAMQGMGKIWRDRHVSMETCLLYTSDAADERSSVD